MFPILLVLAIVGGLAAVKAKQIGMLIQAGKAAAAAGPPPEAVASGTAKEDTWEATIPAVGSIEAMKGVTVSNDAPGVVTAIRFESGATVKQGDVLVELDASVERAQLASAVARKSLATTTLARNKALVASGTLPAAQLEGDEAALNTATADAAGLQAQIARKIVRAPFAGKLGIRQVNLGQYLNPGTAITVLQATDADYVDFTLPQQRLADVAVGTPVRLSSSGDDKKTTFSADGVVAAIDPTIDPITRSIRLRATTGKTDKLRPGMFVNVEVVLPQKHKVVSVPATAVVHASYGNSVFVIEDKPEGKVARQQFVRTGESRGDFIAIEDGLKAGQEVVVAGAFKLRNGSRVAIDNTIKPDAQMNPQPENH